MDNVRSRAQLRQSAAGGLPVPRLSKAGVALIAAGLSLDLLAHTVLRSIHHEPMGAFPLQEHVAHLVVVIGMVLVLAGIVADGIRTQRRHGRLEGTAPHAIR